MIDISSFSPAIRAEVIKNARLYLGDRTGCDNSSGGAGGLLGSIDRAVDEICENADFRAVCRIFGLSVSDNGISIDDLALSIASHDLVNLFKDCSRICVIGSTLGVGFDRFLSRISCTDMSHAVVVDATASALLESLTDEYENNTISMKRTFRFAPGYGDVDISFNEPLMRGIGADKQIGLSITPSYLFVPQKSILGLIGIN